jgi:hypothetical protein
MTKFLRGFQDADRASRNSQEAFEHHRNNT